MLKGLGGLGDMAKMMKAAQGFQEKMAQLQEDLGGMTVVGESGAGLVRATATAKGELTGLEIDPSIFVASEKEVVEDLILAAIKDAQSKALGTGQGRDGQANGRPRPAAGHEAALLTWPKPPATSSV